MKALLWNRPDAHRQRGGDTVQWERTGAELERLGIEVRLTLDPDPELGDCDLVHLFNLQRQSEALAVAEKARAAGKKLALSTIWWDQDEAKFEVKSTRSRLLRVERSVLGRRRALARFRRFRRRRKRGRRAAREVRRLVELCDVLLPNSREELAVLEGYHGFRGLLAKTVVVPNATSFIGAPGTDAEEARAGILCVGRVQALKNQTGLIRALCGLDVPISLVGDLSNREYVARCRRLADRHGRVEFLGLLGHEDVLAHYRRAAIHVLPSFQESTGLVSLEAASAGCTVVTTDRGPTAEYFGDEAYLCDPTDLASIRAAVEEALATPRVMSAERLGRYTWKKAALATRQAYRWLFDETVERPLELGCGLERFL